MVQTLYAVFDTVSKKFSTPFTEVNDAAAKRGFELAQCNQNTLVGLAPQDYTLYAVGGFNDDTGEFIVDELAFPRKVVDGKPKEE